MSNLRILNGEIVNSEKVEFLDLFVKDGLIDFVPAFGEGDIAHTIDARNCYITCGLFDLQVNGSQDCDLWAQPGLPQFANLCATMLKAGVTAFLPTLITADFAHLHRNIRFLETMGAGGSSSTILNQSIKELLDLKFYSKSAEEARLMVLPGIHLEGPYLSPQRIGAHPPQYIREINMAKFAELMQTPVKLVTIAPELENGDNAINYLLENKISPSLGHSNATFAEASRAFASGVQMVTHIFNALPPIQQRAPGAITAALLNDNVYCCVICDGLHVDPEMVRLLVKIKGIDKVILVTDIAHIGTTGGSLIGSSIKLSDAVSNIVNWGIVNFQQAIQMSTLNPARAMRLDDEIGKIEKGRRADLVIWNKESFKVKHVIANGITVV